MDCPKCNGYSISREMYDRDEIGVFTYEYYRNKCADCGCEFKTVETYRYEETELLEVDGVDVAEEI